MAKLSILIAAEHDAEGIIGLADFLLRNAELDIEVVVGGRTDSPDVLQIAERYAEDSRLKFLTFNKTETSRQALWSALVEASSGDWLTLCKPLDLVDPELVTMLQFLEKARPNVDAFGWNLLHIDNADLPSRHHSIALPVDFHVSSKSQPAMLDAYFTWQNGATTTCMPIGLYHGAIRRSLALSVAQTLAETGRISSSPQHEWAARSLVCSNEIAFSERPLSIVSKHAFAIDANGIAAPDFPFHPALGEPAALAEVQHNLFLEMNLQWGEGAEDGFVRACMNDCQSLQDQATFETRRNAYANAFALWRGGASSDRFNPHYLGEQRPDTRRGLHGKTLMVDRFIGNARTAQTFYRAASCFLAPIRMICGGTTVGVA